MNKRDLKAIVEHALELNFDELSIDCVICEAIAEATGVELVENMPTHPPSDKARYE